MIRKKLIRSILEHIRTTIALSMLNTKDMKKRLRFQLDHIKYLENMLLAERRFLEHHLDENELKEKVKNENKKLL